ncbi:uncharacterized protein LOC143887554 [Tasmannia lanceolata]|uniref:uncharacterized protein LOC143887554 n=1 Tax=Tasmannia lanceolata TaxID=3420 RepID=UPI00406380F4
MSGKGSSHKPSSSHQKPSRESGNPVGNRIPGSDFKPPINKPIPNSLSDPILPLPFPHSSGILPSNGIHMFDRRNIVLADGTVRSYFALPPNYSHPHLGLGLGFENQFHLSSLGFDGRGPPMLESSLKRKYSDDEGRGGRDGFTRQQYRNPKNTKNPNGGPDFMVGASDSLGREILDCRRGVMHGLPGDSEEEEEEDLKMNNSEEDLKTKNSDVNPIDLKRAFLLYSKLINENAVQRKNYLENGKHGGPIRCLPCGKASMHIKRQIYRAAKDFTDLHRVIMHAYYFRNPDIRADHLGFHKALCVLMGWNYAKAPDNSKSYQSLSAADGAKNREDLIIWPPIVVIHNTNFGRNKDGRMEGMGNTEMDNKLKELGFSGGKSESMHGEEGHLGTTIVKFASDQSGLNEAECLAEFFEKDNHGRRGWAHAQALQSRKDYQNNPYLVKVDEKTGEKKRIFYGYLGTASDLHRIDFNELNVSIKSRREFDSSDLV